MNTADKTFDSREPTKPEVWLEYVRREVKSLRFGIVQIVVHDARVVQIDKTEKIRLNGDEHR